LQQDAEASQLLQESQSQQEDSDMQESGGVEPEGPEIQALFGAKRRSEKSSRSKDNEIQESDALYVAKLAKNATNASLTKFFSD
jgi:hypothetical protein